MDISDLVMRLGRPIVVVPPSIDELSLEHVVVGWKDTRETRRAVLDALPLLRNAGQVTVMEIVEDPEALASTRQHLAEVTSWLTGHGVAAHPSAELLSASATAELEAAAAARNAGLLVIGAYGHNRLREWVLGGVTRDALRHPARCSFMSH
jgi:nucleotide-binding universal stress UspA family protein